MHWKVWAELKSSWIECELNILSLLTKECNSEATIHRRLFSQFGVLEFQVEVEVYARTGFLL